MVCMTIRKLSYKNNNMPLHTGLGQGFLAVGLNLDYKNLTKIMKQKNKFSYRLMSFGVQNGRRHIILGVFFTAFRM